MEYIFTRHKNPTDEVKIGLIGKYVELQDSYKSILEAFTHAGAANEVKVVVKSIHSEYVTAKNVSEILSNLDGILWLQALANEVLKEKLKPYVMFVKNIPFFGICLGMQMAVIEFARTVLGLSDANSSEMNLTTKTLLLI